MRGEKYAVKCNIPQEEGSPPLARGKALFIPSFVEARGITPACAGKRDLGATDSSYKRDHPRLRGEKLPPQSKHERWQGSPPLARGKDDRITAVTQEPRITPACAGKSTMLHSIRQGSRDHPRLRGEKAYAGKAGADSVGSPPLARGKVTPAECGYVVFGITPACAGKSTY